MQVDLGKIKITWKGLYSAATEYEKDDAVFYGGSSFIFVADTPATGTAPTVGVDTATWEQMAAGMPTMTARGEIVFQGASGPVSLAPGTSGYVLTTKGAGADPAWELPSSRQGATVKALPKTSMYGGSYRSGGVIMSDETLRCWGSGESANLGQGTYLADRSAPIMPAFPKTTATVTQWHRTGHSNWCLMSDGSVYVWGYNGYGQLGTGNTTQVNTPTKVTALDGVNIVGISVGNASSYSYCHVFFLADDGTVYACGYNAYGQLGLGDTTTRSTPTALAKTDFAQVLSVSCQFGSSFGIDTAGALWAWGDNSSGKLGLGSTTNQTTPQQVTLPTTASKVSSQDDRYAAAAVHEGHTLVLLTDGRVYAAGDNTYGQLGLGNTTNYTSFQHVSALGTDNAEVIAAGGFYGYSIVRKTDNTIRTFGYNGYGKLGKGDTTNTSSPANPSGVTNVSKIVPFGHYEYSGIALLMSDGTVKTAGYNANGQCGVGNVSNVTSFTEVPFMKQTITDICAVGMYGETGIGFLTNLGLYFQTGYAGESQLPEDDDEYTTVPFHVQF